MKAAVLTAVALLVGAPVRARADDGGPAPAPDPALATELALSRVLVTIRNGDAKGLLALLDRKVAHDVDAPACGKVLRRPGTLAGKARLHLARCMLRLDWPRAGVPTVIADASRGRIRVEHDGQALVLAFAFDRGAARLSGFRYGALGDPLRGGARDILGMPDDPVDEPRGVPGGVGRR